MNNNEEDYIDDAFDEDAYEEDQKEDKKQTANVVGNAHVQNELVDKEVEQVVMKSTSAKEKKPAAGGYALPGDTDPDEENQDDQDEQEEQDQDEDEEEVQEDHGEDEEDIDQQIVNITSKNQRAQPQPLTDEQMAQKQQNDAILVINNQQNADRPQTKQVKQR